MIDRKKVIKGMKCCYDTGMCFHGCPYYNASKKITECTSQLALEALDLLKEQGEQIKNRDESLEKAREEIKWLRGMLKEQEIRELTMDEWQEWKTNKKRDPICKLWEHDTSPMWILNPNEVNEPALLMGKLKLFTGKPTFEQCKEVKWE